MHSFSGIWGQVQRFQPSRELRMGGRNYQGRVHPGVHEKCHHKVNVYRRYWAEACTGWGQEAIAPPELIIFGGHCPPKKFWTGILKYTRKELIKLFGWFSSIKMLLFSQCKTHSSRKYIFQLKVMKLRKLLSS